MDDILLGFFASVISNLIRYSDTRTSSWVRRYNHIRLSIGQQPFAGYLRTMITGTTHSTVTGLFTSNAFPRCGTSLYVLTATCPEYYGICFWARNTLRCSAAQSTFSQLYELCNRSLWRILSPLAERCTSNSILCTEPHQLKQLCSFVLEDRCCCSS